MGGSICPQSYSSTTQQGKAWHSFLLDQIGQTKYVTIIVLVKKGEGRGEVWHSPSLSVWVLSETEEVGLGETWEFFG